MHDRRLAAILLSEIAPAAEEAIPALLEAANDEDDGVSEMVVSALDQIDLAQGGEAEAA